jgi:hypothetical protein
MNYKGVKKLIKSNKEDWQFVSGQGQEIIRSDGQYINFLPETEKQNIGIEKMNCATFASLNDIEILAKVKYGLIWNKSDRFSSKIGKTTKEGAYINNVADGINNFGLVDESIYPYVDNWNEYYKDISQLLFNKGKEFLDDWVINYRFVYNSNFWHTQEERTNSLLEALPYGPICVTVLWSSEKNDVVIPKKLGTPNHFETLVGYKLGEWWYTFDSYERFLKRRAWDTYFGAALIYYLTYKKMSLAKIIQIEGTDSIYVGEEQTNEAALYSKMLNCGLIPPMVNGQPNTIDWSKIKPDFIARENN